MEASAPPITDVLDIVSAEEVCEYTYKVELIEKDKISLVIFNTNTGIKYQTYIEEYSDLWDTLKVNFQHNFSLCLKILMKALLDKDPSFTVNVLHKIDYVILQLTYINDMMGFTIELNVNQYKKDNLQESVNRLQYKQSQLEQENKSLKGELQSVHQEIKELKRIINLLGDGFSYDNRLLSDNDDIDIVNKPTTKSGVIPKSTEELSFNWSRTQYRGDNVLKTPRMSDSQGFCSIIRDPLMNVTVVNKLADKYFEEYIKKYKLPYDIKTHGYNWKKLYTMSKEQGCDTCLKDWQSIFYPHKTSIFKYDSTWKSFKELFDIKI